MAEKEITLEPWHILYGADGILPIANDAGLILAHVLMPKLSTPAEWLANAHLITAAPDMLEELEWAHSQLCAHPEWCDANHPTLAMHHGRMRFAIAKAKGLNDPSSTSHRVPCNRQGCNEVAFFSVPPGVYYDRLLWTCPKHRD